MKIVQQPFRRRRDRLMSRGCPYNCAISFAEDPCIVVKARGERTPPSQSRRNTLGDRQALRMLFKALNTEQFGSNGRLGDSGANALAQKDSEQGHVPHI